jgi:small subunit ribosomal protein S3
MGQKVHPYGFRLGYIKDWHSNWYSKTKDDYAETLKQDLLIRKYVEKELANAGIAKTEITRTADQTKVTVYSAKPGVAIGKKGAGIDKVRVDLKKIAKGPIFFNIAEVKRPDAEAKLIAENIAAQLEKRVSFRRAMKKVMTSAFRSGVKGIKVKCAGRLGGAEMARTEGYSERKVPLHTLRADIDYATAEANTTYGIIGVKVWVYKGEIYK